jgi:hypothetical protein
MSLCLLEHIPELHSTVDAACCSEFKLFTVVNTVYLLAARDKGTLEPAYTQVKTINFVSSAYSKQIGAVGVVDYVTSEARNSNFEVFSILCVQFNVSVSAEKSKFGVVF